MKSFALSAALPAALLAAVPAYGQGPKPPQAPPVRLELSVDPVNKVVTVPADWTVVRPAQAPPVKATAPAVAVPVPFGTVAITPVTTVPSAAVQSTSRSVGLGLTRTRTDVGTTGPFGGITISPFGGCANGQCGAPQVAPAFRPFGGFFRR